MFPDTPVHVRSQHDQQPGLRDDGPKEECGVFGVSTPHGEGIAQLAFFGLFALQHRGQEAAGIAVSDGSRVRCHKDTGLVANVFTPATMATLTGYPRSVTPATAPPGPTHTATISRSWWRRCTARWRLHTTATW